MTNILILNTILFFILGLIWTASTWTNIIIRGVLIGAFVANLFALLRVLGFVVAT